MDSYFIANLPATSLISRTTVIFRQETGESLQLPCDLQMKPQHQRLYNTGNIIQRNSSSSHVIIKRL